MPGIEELYPMGMEAARKASDQFADQEMMADVQRRIKDPDNRFGGVYGLLPHLGYTRGEGATYRNVMGGTTGRAKVGTSTSRTLGLYQQEDDDDGVTYGLFSDLLEEQGLDRMAPGEFAFNMLNKDSPEMEAETIFHEFTHRALDPSSKLGKDFMAHIEGSEDLIETQKNSLKSAFTDHATQENIASVYDTTDNIFLYSDIDENTETRKSLFDIQKKINRIDIKNLTREFQKFLTPEKQEEHGIRLPVPAAVPQDLGPEIVSEDIRGLDRFFR